MARGADFSHKCPSTPNRFKWVKVGYAIHQPSQNEPQPDPFKLYTWQKLHSPKNSTQNTPTKAHFKGEHELLAESSSTAAVFPKTNDSAFSLATHVNSNHVLMSFMSPDVPFFTVEEYDAFLKDDEWTFDETAYLMELARLYDVRFHVITDRYAYEAAVHENATNEEKMQRPPVRRTIEEIKERFFNVRNKLFKFTAAGNNSESGGFEPVAYDRKEEVARKRELEGIFRRTQEQMFEEAFLTNELHRMLQSFDGLVADREEALRLHLGDLFVEKWANGIQHPSRLNAGDFDADATFLHESATARGRPESAGSSNRRKKASHPTSASSFASSAGSGDGSRHFSRSGSQSGMNLMLAKSSPLLQGSGTFASGLKERVAHPGVYLRSSRLSIVKIGYSRAVERILADFALPSKPLYASVEHCKLYDELRQLAVKYLDTHKHIGHDAAIANLYAAAHEPPHAPTVLQPPQSATPSPAHDAQHLKKRSFPKKSSPDPKP